jgi:hypothetical protein
VEEAGHCLLKVLSQRTLGRCYNQDQLALAVGGLQGFSRCELLLLEGGGWGRKEFGNPEDESSIQSPSIVTPYTWQYSISYDNHIVFFFLFILFISFVYSCVICSSSICYIATVNRQVIPLPEPNNPPQSALLHDTVPPRFKDSWPHWVWRSNP